MPWDGSRIVVATVEDGATKVIAGGEAIAVRPAALFARRRPARVRQRRRGLVDDLDRRRRRWNTQPVLGEPREHAEPAWGPGQRSYAWSPDGEQIAWCRNEDGFGRLVIATPGSQLGARVVEGLAPRARLGRAGDRVRAFRRGDTVASRRARGERIRPAHDRTRARSVGSSRHHSSSRGAISASPATRPCTALLYRPPGAGRVRRSSCTCTVDRPVSRPRIGTHACNGCVQRGYAVLQPNYRGSTGYGRAYAQSLSGRWGERDVADVAAGIRTQ